MLTDSVLIFSFMLSFRLMTSRPLVHDHLNKMGLFKEHLKQFCPS